MKITGEAYFFMKVFLRLSSRFNYIKKELNFTQNEFNKAIYFRSQADLTEFAVR
jgi:hypothetical protein